MSIFYELFPINRKHLLGKISGSSIFSEMTSEEFQEMIISCLTGDNPRLKTEIWAQSKVFHGVFSGLEEMFSKGKSNDRSFIEKAPLLAAECLKKHYGGIIKLIEEDKRLCQWICNLTAKGYDNILQANPEYLLNWAESLTESIKNIPYGSFENNIKNIAIYNASIAKKGALKSAFGNLFEHLFLYSSLTAIGIKHCDKDKLNLANSPSFALDINEGRQCDARIITGLDFPEKIDIDIGFIGKGNPEIIADKTQRFGNLLGGGEKPLQHTLIIVSAIPKEAQLVVKQASLLGAKVITMSGNNWLHEIYSHLSFEIGIKNLNPISQNVILTKQQLKEYLPNPIKLISEMPRDLIVPNSWQN